MPAQRAFVHESKLLHETSRRVIPHADQCEKTDQIRLLENAINELRHSLRANSLALMNLGQMIRNLSIPLAKNGTQNRYDAHEFRIYLHYPAMLLLLLIRQIRRRCQ